MRCGSRDSNPMADRMYPGEDNWTTHNDGSRTCTFCGSLHEDDMIDILEHFIAGDEGYEYDPTTKDYKRYAHRPGVSNAGDGGIKFYGWHASKDKRERLNELDQKARVKFNEWMRQRFGARA